MLKTTIRMAVAATLMITPASAEPAGELEKFYALGNVLGEELVTCSAFYVISAIGFEMNGTPEAIETAAMTKQQARLVLHFAKSIGKTIHQKPEVVDARFEMWVKMLRKEMGDAFTNYSILLNKYAAPCAELMRDPELTVSTRLGIPLAPRSGGALEGPR